MHLTGIEPAHLSIPDPKSGASAYSATGAFQILVDYILALVYNKINRKFGGIHMKKPLKIILRVLLVFVIIIALIASAGGIYYGASKTCDLTVKINENEEIGDFYGWGTSDCWWADDIKDEATRQEVARLLFSEEGLNLNIYRYCLYGGYDPANNRVDNQFRLGESFLVYNEETDSYEYDWSRDAASMAMLNEALKYNVDTVILFANSPHYSMCINGQSSGADSGDGVSNIDESRYQDYVNYFLDITEHFIEQGIPVKYISPINEPQWGWGGEYVAQEGCHYEKEQAAALIKLFAQEIIKRGLNVKLYVLESGSIGDTAKDYYNMLAGDDEIKSVMGANSYHSYFNDNDQIKKAKFGKWAKENVDIRFDMSEWCELPTEGDASELRTALRIARVISQDVGTTKVNSWTNWVAINEKGVNEEDGKDYSDGLLVADKENMNDYYIASRYYGYQHFSRFVPTGSKLIDCGDGVFTVAATKDDDGVHFRELVNETAFKTPDGKIVLVVVNEGNERNLKINLDGYSNVQIYTTDENNNCNKLYSGTPNEIYDIGSNSINTFIFSK